MSSDQFSSDADQEPLLRNQLLPEQPTAYQHSLPAGYPDPSALWSSPRTQPQWATASVRRSSAHSVGDAVDDFTARLAKLSRAALALTRTTDVDDFCRMAIVLGRQELGFDRLGLLLMGKEPGVLYGTFGTDEEGNLRDERTFSFAVIDNPLLLQYTQLPNQTAPYLFAPVANQNVVPAQDSWSAVVGLWDNDTLIGYLFADNFLALRPYTTGDGQILGRYAATLGHLFTHFRIEETLLYRRHAANDFLNYMSTLSKVIATLTLTTSFDEFCYKAIDLGRRQLGFDRLSLWFTAADDPTSVVGSYGTDTTGQISDERHLHFPMRYDHKIGKLLLQGKRYVLDPGALLFSLDGVPLKYGWNAAAALWNGEQSIGYLFTDNLLQQRPYSENDGEMLALYALLLGHLCTRLRIEEALREREASYRTLIDAIPDYMFVVTRDGLILDYHEAQPATIAIPMDKMVGQLVSNVVYKKAAARYTAAIEKAFATGKVITFEYPLQHETLHYHLEVRVTAGNHDKVVVLVRDVTNRKLLEEQLVGAQKMESLGRMASGIAHDFNNLLTVIQGFASVATTVAVDGPPRLIKALERISLASEKGAHLTHQLLLFARKQVVQSQILNVNEQIQSLTTILEPVLGEQITLALHCDSTPGYVYMNPGQFEQIMVNLAVNARDAMPAGGTFTIATCIVTITETDSNQWLQLPPNIYALIEVSDTGIGMSEEVQKQIFEPFFTTKEMGKGTGLGLAICHGIIRQNGGHIQVHSQLDKGTVFSLYLPITARQPEAPTLFAEQARASGTETILLVEDDEPVRAMAAEVLASHGYKVLAYATGSEALQRVRDYFAPISLLMTDMIMPQMSGREVAEQFMQLYPGVPVLLVSGYVGELPEGLVNKPNVRFLPKPYAILHLVEAVRTSIDQHPWRGLPASLGAIFVFRVMLFYWSFLSNLFIL